MGSTSVSLVGDYIIVGAPGQETSANGAGAAYLFGYDGESWPLVGSLLDAEAASGDYFGGSVSFYGSYILIGAEGVKGQTSSESEGGEGGAGGITVVNEAGVAYFYDLTCGSSGGEG